MGNTVQLTKNGQPVFPVTDVSLVMGLNEGALQEAKIAWDGESTPMVADIPSGVTVTYNSTTYTGTLVASEDSVGQEYWVSDGNGGYDRYMANATSGTYQWKNIGNTDIDLTTYAKQADLNQLDQEVNETLAKIYTPVASVTSGKYVDFNGAIQTSANYSIIGPIALKTNQVISVRTKMYNVTVVSLSDSGMTSITPVVLATTPSSSAVDNTYYYKAITDCYVIVSVLTADYSWHIVEYDVVTKSDYDAFLQSWETSLQKMRSEYSTETDTSFTPTGLGSIRYYEDNSGVQLVSGGSSHALYYKQFTQETVVRVKGNYASNDRLLLIGVTSVMPAVGVMMGQVQRFSGTTSIDTYITVPANHYFCLYRYSGTFTNALYYSVTYNHRADISFVTFSEDGAATLSAGVLSLSKCYIYRNATSQERYLFTGTVNMSTLANPSSRKLVYDTTSGVVSMESPNAVIPETKIVFGLIRRFNGYTVYIPGIDILSETSASYLGEFAGRIDDKNAVTTSVGLDGYYVHSATGRLTSSTDYAVTTPIHLDIGDIIIMTGYVTPDLAAISEYIGTGCYKDLVPGVERASQSCSYVATRPCDVCLSYRKANGLTVHKYKSYRFAEFTKFAFAKTERRRLLNGQLIDCCYSAISGGLPQNTEAHFLHAVSKGFNSLKADMRLTSDGKIVLNHDAGITLDDNGRITNYSAGSSTAIHNITYAEYMAYEYRWPVDGNYVHPCDLDSFLAICKRYNAIPYLTFRNEYVDDTLIELKRLLSKYGYTSNAIINLYPTNETQSSKIRSEFPDILICNTTDGAITENMIYSTIQYDNDILCLQRSPNKPIDDTLRELANKLGLSVWIWTYLNPTEEDFYDAIKEGATGFQMYSYDINIATPESNKSNI